ncbi:hypothetical protein [Paraburkholderia sp. J41]|uniref:hypothetical protein n=1 Tax=Paraburkholderia sp. J41 TaxID=2805433 RepID=UPI002AC34BDC|nr:hypothetical protein [Paraburkholderia sp. J41]
MSILAGFSFSIDEPDFEAAFKARFKSTLRAALPMRPSGELAPLCAAFDRGFQISNVVVKFEQPAACGCDLTLNALERVEGSADGRQGRIHLRLGLSIKY